MLWSMDIVKLNDKIADIISQDRLLAQLKQQGLVDPDLFISRRDRLAEQLRTAKLEKEHLLEAEEDQTIRHTLTIVDVLELTDWSSKNRLKGWHDDGKHSEAALWLLDSMWRDRST